MVYAREASRPCTLSAWRCAFNHISLTQLTPSPDSLDLSSEFLYSWLGALALYLVAAHTGALVLRLSRPTEQSLLLRRLLVAAVICLTAAAAVNTFVELPARRLVRTAARRGGPSRAGAV